MTPNPTQQANGNAATSSPTGADASGSPNGSAVEAVERDLDATAQAFSDFLDLAADNWQQWAIALGLIIGALVVGWIAHRILFAVLRRFARTTGTKADEIFIRRIAHPARVLLPLLAVQLVLRWIAMPEAVRGGIRHALAIGLIVGVAWLLIGATFAAERLILRRHDVAVRDNLRARQVHTQFRVIRRIIAFFIFVVAGASVLMTFPSIRQVGASLLASAGLAGLVIGLAARPAVENLLAGLQIALTQPIRLDDVVIVGGEWGRIEEITSTYVVVKIWDERRLIVPFSKFIAESFQNWTRTTADLLGSVFVHVDYKTPVARVREELERIVKDHPKWDGRVAGLQVTEATDRTIQLRALVSAGDASSAWDLRCDVRERLIDFLQRELPECLPREREEHYSRQG